MKPKRAGFSSLATIGAMTLLSAAAIAQPPGGGPPPGGGGGGRFQMSPEWKKYNESHKHLRELSQLMGKVEKLNQEDDLKFAKPQAVKLLSLINKNAPKKSLSEDDADSLIKSINGLMTTKQIKKMTTFTDMRGGRPGGGAPGGGAPGGRPPGGGGPPGGFGGGRPGGGGPPGGGAFKMPEVPKTGYNPLNPDTLPFERMRPRAKKGLDDLKAELSKQAK